MTRAATHTKNTETCGTQHLASTTAPGASRRTQRPNSSLLGHSRASWLRLRSRGLFRGEQ